MKYLIEYEMYIAKCDDYVRQVPVLVDGDNRWDAEQRFRCNINEKLGTSLIVNRVYPASLLLPDFINLITMYWELHAKILAS